MKVVSIDIEQNDFILLASKELSSGTLKAQSHVAKMAYKYFEYRFQGLFKTPVNFRLFRAKKKFYELAFLKTQICIVDSVPNSTALNIIFHSIPTCCIQLLYTPSKVRHKY